MNLAMDLIREALLGGEGGGGGGGGGVDLLVTESLGHIYADATPAIDIGKTVTIALADLENYDVLIGVAYAQKSPGKHYATVQTMKVAANDAGSGYPNKNAVNSVGGGHLQFYLSNDGTLFSGSASTTSNRGIYGIATVATGNVSIKYYAYYHTDCKLIDGDYTLKIYGVNVYSLFAS